MNIKIYQLSSENERAFIFEPWECISEDFEFENYNLVWEGTFEEFANVPSTNNIWNLDKIFSIFNCSRPDNFKGHSLSVSDIVVLDGEYYYCDSYGWEKITNKI